MKKKFFFQIDLIFYAIAYPINLGNKFQDKLSSSASPAKEPDLSKSKLFIPGPGIISLFKKVILEQEKIFFLPPSSSKKKSVEYYYPSYSSNYSLSYLIGLKILANENIPYLILENEDLENKDIANLAKRNEILHFFIDKKNLKKDVFAGLKAELDLQPNQPRYELHGFSHSTVNFKPLIKKVEAILKKSRNTTHERNTKETKIKLKLNLDGRGKNSVSTGLGFLDHMLDLLSKHAGYDLFLKVKGDLEIDEHHTIEDTAIALGEAIKKALGDKVGIKRYAFHLPMDESEAKVLLDISNRPLLKFKGKFTREKVGDFPTEMVEHFFYSLAMAAGFTLHLEIKGKNDHHQIEGAFKALAKCLSQATKVEGHELPSTKGML